MSRSTSGLVVIHTGTEKNIANRNHESQQAYHMNGTNSLFWHQISSAGYKKRCKMITRIQITPAKLWHHKSRAKRINFLVSTQRWSVKKNPKNNKTGLSTRVTRTLADVATPVRQRHRYRHVGHAASFVAIIRTLCVCWMHLFDWSCSA